MTDHPGLFDRELPPFQRHSDTSRAAAIAKYPVAGTERWRVLQHLEKLGATDDEIQVALAMNPSTERPRRIELCNKGFVEKTEGRRPTRAGKMAAVYRVRR